MVYVMDDAVRTLLEADGFHVDETAETRFRRHLECIHLWNDRLSLVSQGDVARLVENHLVDSVSLATYVRAACGEGGWLLDIGGGGGFPAVPLKILMPDLRVCLVERSEKKSDFLRRLVGGLELEDVDVRFGEFPRESGDVRPSAMTARAVERAEKVRHAVYRFMPEGCTFLCQSRDPQGEVRGMFHVEHIVDAWTRRGLRRGSLWLVRR